MMMMMMMMRRRRRRKKDYRWGRTGNGNIALVVVASVMVVEILE
jgi:hypothetical protein